MIVSEFVRSRVFGVVLIQAAQLETVNERVKSWNDLRMRYYCDTARNSLTDQVLIANEKDWFHDMRLSLDASHCKETASSAMKMVEDISRSKRARI
jgi:hypothetical protein